MKKYLTLLLILLSTLSYSQKIGYKTNIEGMDKIEYKNYDNYTYESFDSTCYINASKDSTVLSIDYVISREKVSQNGLNWVIKHTQIAINVYYDGDYYFILPRKDHFLIQVRNVDEFLQ